MAREPNNAKPDIFIVLGNDDTRDFDDLVTQIVASWN